MSAQPLGTMPPTSTTAPRALRVVPAVTTTTTRTAAPDFGPQVTRIDDLPEVGPWAVSMARLILEAMDGTRPPAQLRKWLSIPLHQRISRRAQSARVRRQRPRCPLVRSTLVTHPAEGIAEVSLVVSAGDRVRALAMRLDGLDGRWVVTAFELG